MDILAGKFYSVALTGDQIDDDASSVGNSLAIEYGVELVALASKSTNDVIAFVRARVNSKIASGDLVSMPSATQLPGAPERSATVVSVEQTDEATVQAALSGGMSAKQQALVVAGSLALIGLTAYLSSKVHA